MEGRWGSRPNQHLTASTFFEADGEMGESQRKKSIRIGTHIKSHGFVISCTYVMPDKSNDITAIVKGCVAYSV